MKFIRIGLGNQVPYQTIVADPIVPFHLGIFRQAGLREAGDDRQFRQQMLARRLAARDGSMDATESIFHGLGLYPRAGPSTHSHVAAASHAKPRSAANYGPRCVRCNR